MLSNALNWYLIDVDARAFVIWDVTAGLSMYTKILLHITLLRYRSVINAFIHQNIERHMFIILLYFISTSFEGDSVHVN